MKRDAELRSHVTMQSGRTGRDPAHAPLIVRQFESSDAAAVRALFIKINRLMVLPHLADHFEVYMATALRQEIDIIARYYAAHGGQFFVATARGSLVGMFGLEQADVGVKELRRMYVDPQFRRSGIGRRLLARAEIEARMADCTRMILSTSELQSAALELYRQAGYREVRQEIATQKTNKTIGGAIRRFHFEKMLTDDCENPIGESFVRLTPSPGNVRRPA